MKYIDLAFYAIAEYYRRKEGGAYRFSGICIVTLIISLNILTILFSIEYYKNLTIFPSKYYVFYYVMIPVAIIFSVRYFYFKEYEDIRSQYIEYSVKERDLIGIVTLSYIVISFLTCIGVAIYIGELRNP